MAVDGCGPCRISSISSKPSILGICMSIKISAKGSPASCASDNFARASSPSCTELDFISHRPSIPSRIRRFVRLSSTTRTLTARKISGGAIAPTSITFVSAIPRRAVKWNWLPRPSSLSTQIFPLIISTSLVEMVKPRPVPPYFRVVEVSAWENGSKINCSFSPGIPTPVSTTVNRSVQSCSWIASTSTFSATSPFSVNFMALPARLMMT